MSPDVRQRLDLVNMAQLFAYHHGCARGGHGTVCERCTKRAQATIVALHRDRHPTQPVA